MKKVLFLLAIAFTATYCNPAQQTEQTVVDSNASTNTTANSVATDTTARDTTIHQ